MASYAPQYMVPVQNAGQQLYLNPSTQHSPGGNIIQLPSMVPAGYSPGHAVSALPPQYVVAQHTGGQPMGYFPNTPIVPVQALPQVQYVQAQTQPQVHYALAPSNSPLTVWDVELPPTTVRAANPTYPILPHLSAVEPPTKTMRLVCKDMPWVITIKKAEGVVTINDVYEAIYIQLRERILHSEWRLMGSSQRGKSTQAYANRNERLRIAREQEDTGGIRRVDYLLGRTQFIGLKYDPKAIGDLIGDIEMPNAWLLILGDKR